MLATLGGLGGALEIWKKQFVQQTGIDAGTPSGRTTQPNLSKFRRHGGTARSRSKLCQL